MRERTTHVLVLTLSALFGTISISQPKSPTVEEIVLRSAAATQADWQKAPGFDFCELDETGKIHKTYQVLMVNGSPYSRLVAVNGKGLPIDTQNAEAQKLAANTLQRQQETVDQHRRRVEQYERERRRDQLLLAEFTQAMEFTLVGSEMIDAREAYVLDAKPRPNYVPKTMETKVLTGMRGRLWVDHDSFRWVKAEAEAFRPVTIEGFLARVEPGTRFELEEMPIGDSAGTWLVSHFAMQAYAKVLLVFPKSSEENSKYFHYQPNGTLMPDSCLQP